MRFERPTNHIFSTEQRPLGRHRIHFPQARLWLRLLVFQHRLFHHIYLCLFFIKQVFLHDSDCHHYQDIIGHQVQLDDHQDDYQATTNHDQHQAC